MIAKIDATANDVPEKIQGFPTIKLYPAGSKANVVDYTGGRTLEDMANFIKENGSNGVDGLVVQKRDEDVKMTDVAQETLAKAAPAATEAASSVSEAASDAATGAADAVKSAVSGAAEAIKMVVGDGEGDAPDTHDEL